MSKLITLWLAGLVLLALLPASAPLFLWAAAPLLVVPVWLVHCLTSRS